MSLLKKLAGETAIYGISSILGRVLSWGILTPYLTIKFSQGGFGIYSVLYAYIAILLVFFTYRFETAYFRFGSSKDDQDRNERYFSTATISLLISTGVFLSFLLIFSESIATALGFAGQGYYVVMFSIIVALDALAALPFARLRLLQRPLRFAFIRIAGIVLNILAIFYLLELTPYLQKSGWTQIAGFYQEEDRLAYLFVANIVASAFVLLLLAREYFRSRWVFDKVLWRKMIWYAAPLVLAGLAGIVNQLIGIPLLKFLGPGDVEYNEALSGIYSAAARLAVLMNLFIQAFNYAAEPFFFRQASESTNRQIYADVGRAFALVGSLAFLGIMLYLDIIQYILGKDFRVGLGVLPILLIANFFLGLFYNFSAAYKLTDKTHLGGYLALMGAFITLSINISLIPVIEIYAPAWAALACYASMAIGGYWVSRKYYPIPYQIGRMLLYMVCAVGLYGLSYWLDQELALSLWPKMGLNSILFIIFLLGIYRSEGKWLGSVLS